MGSLFLLLTFFKMKKITKILSTLSFVFVCIASSYAQTGKIAGTVLDGEYGNDPLPNASILVKGTSQGTSADFDGKFSLDLEAGTYTLFTIPDTAEWTIIFNKEPGQWGLYNYNPAKDVFRT